jgi:hypothetical protein
MKSKSVGIKEFPGTFRAFVLSVVHVRPRVSLQRVFAFERRRTILKTADKVAFIAVNSHVVSKFRFRCERRRTLVTKVGFQVHVTHHVVTHVKLLKSFVSAEITLNFRNLQVDSVVVALVAHRRKPPTADLTHLFVSVEVGS